VENVHGGSIIAETPTDANLTPFQKMLRVRPQNVLERSKQERDKEWMSYDHNNTCEKTSSHVSTDALQKLRCYKFLVPFFAAFTQRHNNSAAHQERAKEYDKVFVNKQ
jgi:hypothetical protein